jgi:Sugar (and other) transporter
MREHMDAFHKTIKQSSSERLGTGGSRAKVIREPIPTPVYIQRRKRVLGPLYLMPITGLAAPGGLLFDHDTAVISGAVGLLKSHIAVRAAALGWGASSALVGCVLEAAWAGSGCDRCGRRKPLLLSGVCFPVSALGSASVARPRDIGESAPARWLGRLVALNQLEIDLSGQAGRVVYTAQLSPCEANAQIEYYAAAGDPLTMSAPLQALANLYTLNVLNSQPSAPTNTVLLDSI